MAARIGARPHAEGASVLLDQTSRYPETKARAHVALGRKKGFEDLVSYFRGDAAAVVGHDNAHPIAAVPRMLRAVHADAKPAFIRQGIDRIGDEVRDDLAQLAARSLDLQV